MIASIKERLWATLRDKEVSLVMILDRGGHVLWHRGRTIHGRTILEAHGIPKNTIVQALQRGTDVSKHDVILTEEAGSVPGSARLLLIKSLMLHPMDDQLYLYVDSGVKQGFSPVDLEVFRTLGKVLGDVLGSLRKDGHGEQGITGTSTAMKVIREKVVKYAVEDEPVLLLGETGVGKNHIANLIHRFSGRRGSFVTVHVPSIPESLFERELFGHHKGAFTDAVGHGRGLLSEAQGGTLLLDEISEIPLSTQAKLLQLLDTKVYRVLGDPTERRADVRILAATNRDLKHEVSQRRFREDLYYRIHALPIQIPPLRDRPQDIRDLVQSQLHLIRHATLEPDAWAALMAHAWPGNVRELIHFLKRAGIECSGPLTGAGIRTLLTSSPASSGQTSLTPWNEAVQKGVSFWDSAWQAFMDRELSRRELHQFLCEQFQSCGGSLKQLGRKLHIQDSEYPRFVSALHKYRIHPDR